MSEKSSLYIKGIYEKIITKRQLQSISDEHKSTFIDHNKTLQQIISNINQMPYELLAQETDPIIYLRYTYSAHNFLITSGDPLGSQQTRCLVVYSHDWLTPLYEDFDLKLQLERNVINLDLTFTPKPYSALKAQYRHEIDDRLFDTREN